MSDLIKIKKSDVKVEPLQPLHCDHCECYATHVVSIDIRNLGSWAVVGRFCKRCAKDAVRIVRAAL